jgi:heptosyltransferase I
MQAEILFIKTSSLGDIVHHMPAVSDARRHLPDARLSWVVEEAYAPLARLHTGIDEVIPVATRRWRTTMHRPATWRDIGRFRDAVGARSYQAVIDTQGLLRTGLIARCARGIRHGYDRASIKEPLACLFYDVRHRVEWRAHAIPRNRTLCGLALGYEPRQPLDYGLNRTAIANRAGMNAAENAAKNATTNATNHAAGTDVGMSSPRPYAVLIHATAQPGKQWAQPHWVAVARQVNDRGFDVVLPSGSDAERASSLAIAAAAGVGQGLDQGGLDQGGLDHVPERRPLDAVASLIAGASFVIGVDTGLLHVAAALAVPLVAIFIDSEPGLTGPMGAGAIAVVGGKGATPDPADVLWALDRVTGRAPS